MTISSSTAKAVHVSNPAVTDYAFPFKVFEPGQLKVSVLDAVSRAETVLSLAADYTVVGLDQDTGGTVVLTPAGQAKAGTGNNLAIVRNMQFLQDVDYRPHDVFPAETHERALDILTMQDQELRELLGRAVIAPVDQDTPIQYSDLIAETTAAQEAAASSEGSAATAGAAATAAQDAASDAAASLAQFTDLTASASTLTPGQAATAHYDPATGELRLGIPRGEKGEPGEDGKDGSGVNILGAFDSTSELPAGGQAGDAYMVGEDLYIWDAAGQAWTNAGPIRGPKGDQGERGEPGEDGKDGADAVVADATESVKGIVQLASVTDTASADKAVTPTWVAENVSASGGDFTTRETITASISNWVPKKLGLHIFEMFGGGGGGGRGGNNYNSSPIQYGGGGGGGGAGDYVTFYIVVTDFTPIPIVVGAGGIVNSGVGGNSSIVVNGTTYAATGGAGGGGGGSGSYNNTHGIGGTGSGGGTRRAGVTDTRGMSAGSSGGGGASNGPGVGGTGGVNIDAPVGYSDGGNGGGGGLSPGTVGSPGIIFITY